MADTSPSFIANGNIYPSRFVKLDSTANFRVLQCSNPSDRILGVSQPGTYAPPGLVGQTAPALVGGAITNVTFASGLATVTTTSAHGLAVGNSVSIAGVVGAVGVNGNWYVATVPSGTTFTVYTINTPGAYTSGGTTTLNAPLFAASINQEITVFSEGDYQLVQVSGVGPNVASGDYLTTDTNGMGVKVLFKEPFTITGITNANPWVVTTQNAHGLLVGETVQIAGVVGATGSNGTFTVNAVPSATTFNVAATAPGAYTSGGFGSGLLWYGAICCEAANPGELVRAWIIIGPQGCSA